MKIVVARFKGPELGSVQTVIGKSQKVTEVILTLKYPYHGEVITKVTKVGRQYNYYDQGAPIKNRKFNSIKHLMWEYELPKSIIKYLKRL